MRKIQNSDISERRLVASKTPQIGDENHKARRKKRKKKKKKKKPAEDSDASSSSDEFLFTGESNRSRENRKNDHSASNGTAVSMPTSQETVRHRLVHIDGFEPERVDSAMEEMWNQGLSYDEYEAVFVYLNRLDDSAKPSKEVSCNGANKALAITEVLPIEPSSKENLSNLRKEEKSTEDANETGPSSNAIVHDKTYSNAGNDDDVDHPEQEPVEENTQGADPTSIAAKLDIVANFENLNDAIFALTCWVNKAAKLKDIEDMCVAETTKVLVTIIRRGISSDEKDPSQFETSVQSGLVRLLMSVMDRCGVTEEFGETKRNQLEKKMETMLEQARQVCLLAKSNDTTSSINEKFAQFVVSRIRIAVLEKKENDFGRKQPTNISTAIGGQHNLFIGSENTMDNSMLGVWKQRNELLFEAKTASAHAQCAVEKATTSNLPVDESNETYQNEETGEESDDISSQMTVGSVMLCLLGQESKDRFNNVENELEQLRAKVIPKGKNSHILQNLLDSVSDLESKRQTYKDKISELRATIKELETADNEAATEIELLSSKIEEEKANEPLRAKQLEKDIEAVEESVRFGNVVHGLATTMKFYGNELNQDSPMNEEASHDSSLPNSSNKYVSVLHKSVSCTTSTTMSVETTLSMSSSMEDYLPKVRDYFLLESQCAAKLRLRMNAKNKALASLRTELTQYNSLSGMGTVIGQIKSSIVANETILKEDERRMMILLDDCRFMYKELLVRLEEYEKAESAEDYAFFPTPILRDIPSVIRELKIDDNCARLRKFIDETPEGSDVTPSIPEEKTISEASHSRPPTRKPKMTWASATPTVRASELSFVEIQQEQSNNKSRDLLQRSS